MAAFLAAPADTDLGAIVRAIVEGFHPTRVILFGSRARGNAKPHSDYDIVVEHDQELSWHDAYGAVSKALESVPNHNELHIDIKIRTHGQIEQRMDDVGRLDYDIAREGIVLYPPGGHIQRGGRVDRVREGPREPPASVRDWLDRANEDIEMMELALRAEVVPWSGACFHAQQAAEKYLKALLIAHNMRPDRTHELRPLLESARNLGYPLERLDDACETLKEYAVGVRYPEDVPIPGAAKGRAAVDAARDIVHAVKPLLAKLGATGTPRTA